MLVSYFELLSHSQILYRFAQHFLDASFQTFIFVSVCDLVVVSILSIASSNFYKAILPELEQVSFYCRIRSSQKLSDLMGSKFVLLVFR